MDLAIFNVIAQRIETCMQQESCCFQVNHFSLFRYEQQYQTVKQQVKEAQTRHEAHIQCLYSKINISFSAHRSSSNELSYSSRPG